LSAGSEVSDVVKGLHHITLVTSNQEINRRFYTEVLGLRRVKLTVNQDDPLHRHLFYADDKGTTGSAITFFEWPDLPQGVIGLGSPHHLSYTAPSIEALSNWKSWLSSKGVPVAGPFTRDGRLSIYLRDPDGVIIEITAINADNISPEYLQNLNLSETREISDSMRLSTFNHASPLTRDHDATIRFFEKLLGLKHSFTRANPDDGRASILGIGNEERPDFLRYISSDEATRGFVGIGNIHHIAMAVEGDDEQLEILKTLDRVGIKNSGVIDRFWFHSLYFRDPSGNLLEIATKGPGYTADEPLDKLGSSLVLPSWLEPQRSEIERALDETDRSNTVVWPPKSFPKVPSPPENLNAA
jgi:glyoxalase family protein